MADAVLAAPRVSVKPSLRGIPHLVAAIAAVPAVVVLLLYARQGVLTAGAATFGLALVLLLTASAIYHTPHWTHGVRMRLRRLDRSMIYVLIAGSYTPFCVVLGGMATNVLLPLVWAGAALGILKSVAWVRAPRAVTVIPYLLLGWAIVPVAPDLIAAVSSSAVVLLVLGGGLYTVGALAYARRWPNPMPAVFGYHEVFHVLVVAAAACHYAAVWVTVT